MKMNQRVMTLDEFTIQELRNYPGATGQLSGLLWTLDWRPSAECGGEQGRHCDILGKSVNQCTGRVREEAG